MMECVTFNQARFVKTATKFGEYPELCDGEGLLLPEIAVAGRSNVGKSSLLNHLFGTRKLVKVSTSPGKTQHLNFFLVDNSFLFADLPGYGYAKVPKAIKKQWGPMVQTYLQTRSSLHLILFLLDIRRLPNDDDWKFIEWMVAAEKAVILVFTKTDKVRENERHHNTRKIIKILNLANLHHVHYSVKKNRGRRELIQMINKALRDELEWDS